ncbi:MAG: cache domain-containing protein [Candidatus Latescibacteria bacterium]|nr:cache domain-containing protein [Candidatus Latescibacterota bacterium]
MKRLTAVLILALAALLPAAHPAIAQDPEVTAGDVVDRETLKAFVLAAKAYGDKATSLPEYLNILQEFRTEGPWKQGSIYLFLFTTEGIFILHGDDPDLEGQNLIDLEDANGVKIVQELIAVAAEGGGYVEYLWPDPAVEGDEETGSPKVSYGIPYSALGQDFVLGSGFYPGSASSAVADQSWGQLKSRF